VTARRRALVSVSDKSNLLEFVKGLTHLNFEIVSTGGTAQYLRDGGVIVTDIDSVTGFPEILGGRVKTLHPKIHGGLLGIRKDSSHQQQMKEKEICAIDLLVVNLYPFQETAVKPSVRFEEVIEQIDIGGPAMIRSAAKNFGDVAVVVDNRDYAGVLKELEEGDSTLSNDSRFRLAKKAFNLTSQYDAAIATYLSRFDIFNNSFKTESSVFPRNLNIILEKVTDLRYGENPHQQSAFYLERSLKHNLLPNCNQIQGKELSFNNLLDLNSAYQTLAEFDTFCAVIIKHNNPCGVGISKLSLSQAYRRARDCDPVSAFGSVLGFNRKVDIETAKEIATTFIEAVIAPHYSVDALQCLGKKKNLRLLKYFDSDLNSCQWEYKWVEGGLLVQEIDREQDHSNTWQVATERSPSTAEWESLKLSWKVVKHVKSNAIIYTNAHQTIGIGAGQMSRVDSVKLAITKAQQSLQDCVMASDAFFPFRDGIDVAADAGIRAVIQPGGSVRDDEVIQAANEKKMAMVLTGKRHFRH
jgi:phosphoribosylaminoimidazolecarboxamide formyltransferase/IMP cyclohydrolase